MTVMRVLIPVSSNVSVSNILTMSRTCLVSA